MEQLGEPASRGGARSRRPSGCRPPGRRSWRRRRAPASPACARRAAARPAGGTGTRCRTRPAPRCRRSGRTGPAPDRRGRGSCGSRPARRRWCRAPTIWFTGSPTNRNIAKAMSPTTASTAAAWITRRSRKASTPALLLRVLRHPVEQEQVVGALGQVDLLGDAPGERLLVQRDVAPVGVEDRRSPP